MHAKECLDEYLGAGKAAEAIAWLNHHGFAVVPKEPTEEMIREFQIWAACSGYIEKGYRAMLAAEGE